MKAKLSKTWLLRKKSELPFYCKPVALFLTVWLMMLSSFQMHIGVFSYPDLSLALTIFVVSFISLLLGYGSVVLVRHYVNLTPKLSWGYRINLTRLRRVQWWLIAISLSIVLINLAAYGLPPVFRFWGVATLSYVEYGKLKQVLNTATMALFVSASFLSRPRRRKMLIYSFSLLCMLAYATRGFLLVMLVQGLFVYSLRTTAKKRTLYATAFGTLVAAALISDIIGNGRNESTAEAFSAFFGIRDAYANWPMIFLWIIAYVSIPFSNMCWIVHSYPYTGPTLTFLGTLPAGLLVTSSPGSRIQQLGSLT